MRLEMKLNDVLNLIQPTGAKVSGREPDRDGDGFIMYIGRFSEMIFPDAVAHCIPIHVDTYENPDLHEEEAKAVLRRFMPQGKKAPGKSR
jgi:hypothetical protein